MEKFIRRIELEIILKDKKNNTLDTISYVSNGNRDGLAISFNVQRSISGEPNVSTVTVNNMAPAVRKRIVSNVERTAVKLFANYENEPRQLLSIGDLVKAWPEKSGTENKMTLTFMDGITDIVQDFSKRCWPPNTSIRKVVIDLATDLTQKRSVYLDPTNIVIDGIVASRGLTVNSKTSAALDSLAKEYAFSWSIQNGVFQAYKDNSNGKEASRRHFSVSVANSNLIRATPELGEKFMQMVGMKIEAILDARVICRDVIELESIVYPEYSGTYLVHEVEFSGDTFGADWKMTITSKQAGTVAKAGD